MYSHAMRISGQKEVCERRRKYEIHRKASMAYQLILCFYALNVIVVFPDTGVIAFGLRPPLTTISTRHSSCHNEYRNWAQSVRSCRQKKPTVLVSQSSSTKAEPNSSSIPTEGSLKKLTVKHLKELIKELDPPVKTSHLRLKQDIIDFLLDQYNLKSTNDKSSIDRVSKESEQIGVRVDNEAINTKGKHSKKLNRMPSIDADIVPIVDDGTKQTLSPKDIIFEQVLNRYPPLRQLQNLEENDKVKVKDDAGDPLSSRLSQSFTGLGELDIRQKYHPALTNLSSSDLDIVTVGTASCIPGVTRGVSCTALRLQWRRNNNANEDGKINSATGGIWMFDAGEASQLQIQRSGTIRAGKVSKIFITHAHGDHSFGLPGLMCFLGQDWDRDGPPLEIYGPEGLRMWIRSSIRYSVSRIVPPYRVHELMDIPIAPEWSTGRYNKGRYFYQLGQKGKELMKTNGWTKGLAGEDESSWISRAPLLNLEASPQYGEISGGRDIFPRYDHPKCVDGAPIWEVEDEGDVSVYAAPMSHGVPCVGYVVEEQNKPGRLLNHLVEPIARRNLAALRESGMKIPMKVMAIIKELPIGGSYTFPDGTIVRQSDVVEPERKGRKIVICGDTADSRAIAGLAKDCDCLIHEATNAFLNGIDKDTNQYLVSKEAKIHGHSTPHMAGSFAKRIGAKRLILNHFSSRYKGDQSIESISIMTRIERQAMKASDLAEDKVAAAWDLMIMPIPQN